MKLLNSKEIKEIIANPYYRAFYPKGEDGVTEIPLEGDIFSEVNPLMPSDEVIEYLVESSEKIFPKENIRIVLSGMEEAEKSREALKTMLSLNIRHANSRMRFNTILTVCFLIFGALMLSLSFLIQPKVSLTLSTAIDIFGWFAVWEAADIFILQRSEHRHRLVQLMRIYKAEFVIR